MARRPLTRAKSRKIGRRKAFSNASQKKVSASRVNGRRAMRKARRISSSKRHKRNYGNQYEENELNFVTGCLGWIIWIVFFGCVYYKANS